MVPDAILLNIHQHTHTEHKETATDLQAKVEKEHKHCPVEDLFNAPFQGTSLSEFTIQVNHKASYIANYSQNRHADVFSLTHLRGPPTV